MPAAAVIPALIAYIKVAAVKKLVVGFWMSSLGLAPGEQALALFFFPFEDVSSSSFEWVYGFGAFTLKKMECSKQADAIEHISME